MSTRNLFIITDKGVFIGRATFHKVLAEHCGIRECEITHGGGVFDQRTDENEWVLFGQSFDFGKFDVDMLEHFIGTGEVYWLRRKFDKKLKIDVERVEKDSDAF